MKKYRPIYVLFLCILVGVITGCANNHTTVKEKVDQANYIKIKFPQSGVIQYVDLSAKRLYGNGTAAIGDTIYAYQIIFHNKYLGFNYFKRKDMLYPIVADNTTAGEVKRSNYVIVKNVKNKLDQRKIIDIWHGDGFKGYKVKVFYNNDCLPVKVQLINRETSRWTTIVKYSYLNLTHKEYKNNWKNYVKQVRAGEFEED